MQNKLQLARSFCEIVVKSGNLFNMASNILSWCHSCFLLMYHLVTSNFLVECERFSSDNVTLLFLKHIFPHKVESWKGRTFPYTFDKWERETLKTSRRQSKVSASLNWFNGSVQAGIVVGEHINELKCINRRVITFLKS